MKEIRSNCSFCSLACPLILRGGERGPVFGEHSILSLDWDKSEGSEYGGSLCARGNAVVEFITHPKRLGSAFVLGERSSFEAAVNEVAKNLSAIKEESGAESIGVLVGENLTNEEAALALAFTQDVLGSNNISLIAPDDIPLFRAHLSCDLTGIKPAGPKPAGDRVVSLIVGDSFSEHPCTAKIVLPGKYAARGSEVIVVSPHGNNTALFANRHLRCRPGGEAAVMAGMLKAAAGRSKAALVAGLKKCLDGADWDEIERCAGISKDVIEAAADSLLGAAVVRTYVSNIFGRMGEPALVSLFTEAVTRLCPGDAEFAPQFVQQNTWGIHSVLAAAHDGAVLGRLGEPELKALILLGLDLFSVYPAAPVEKALREKRFNVTSQLFWNQTAARANVVVPAAGLIEKRGTVSHKFGEDLVRNGGVTPPGGAVTDEQLLRALARHMGAELPEAVPVQRVTSRSGSGEWIAGDWASYTGMMKQLESAECVLIPWSEPVHAADGAISRYFNWSEATCNEPKLTVSNELADELKLQDGDRAAVGSDGGEAQLVVERTGKLRGNVVGATIHFPSVRRLFPWKISDSHGEISLAPVPVHIGRQSEKS